MKQITLLILLLIGMQKGIAQSDGCFGLAKFGTIHTFGEKVEAMRFKDGTEHKCLTGLRAVFNNDGVGLLFGYKDGGMIGKTSPDGRVYAEEKFIYKFVIYKSSTGNDWENVTNKEVSKLFTDTVMIGGFDPNLLRYSISTDGKKFYLTKSGGRNTNGYIWYYESSDGSTWQKMTLYDKDLSSVSAFNFLNMDSPTMICNYGWPKVSQGLFSKKGNEWKLNPTYLDRLASDNDILVYHGRKINYHNFNGYLFANKKSPYYNKVNEGSNKTLKLGSGDTPQGWYYFPKKVLTSRTDKNLMYFDFGGAGCDQVYKSTDGGRTLVSMKDDLPVGLLFHFYPICDDGTLFVAGKDKKEISKSKIFRSNDGGKTWTEIAYLGWSTVYDVDFLPDGTFVLMVNSGVWRLKEKCKATSKPDEPLDDFYIVFYAYGPTNPRPKSKEDCTLEKSGTGHIYVGFAKNNNIERVKGLSPKDGYLDMGEVDENTDESYLLGYHTHCFTVKVTKKQYYDALQLTKQYYVSPISDCVSYADDVADLIELITPSTTDAIFLPYTYIGFLKDNNRAVVIQNGFCDIKPKRSPACENQETLAKLEIEKNQSEKSGSQEVGIDDSPTNNYSGLKNGNFDNTTGWKFTGGNVSFNDGKATLQPDKKKIPVVLKHQKFNVPYDANILSFRYDKSKVGEAMFSIGLSGSEGSEVIYSEKISQSLTKFNNGLNVVNTVLNGGELPPATNPEDKFETITLDISRFRGKLVELEFRYETLGMGKPVLIIDDVTIE